ncbi:MAG TPA: Pycsar system effector family protein [Allosphingosinicella sp.]|nr:Pycsar system effector family protein [Allosphingosinicella sp.]
MDQPTTPDMVSSKPPVGHPDYEFPKEVHNLLVTAQTTHVELSAMADSKASILMGATFVVFGLAIEEISSNEATVPLVVLATFSFISTVLSVLAIRPKILKPPRKPGPHTNLLFFGSFAGIPEDEYVDDIIEILRSEEETYRRMARDLYQNGQVLQHKKYKYLSYAYSLFLTGLVTTFGAFLIEMAIRS